MNRSPSCLAIDVGHGLCGRDVVAILERLRFERGLRQRIYCANGAEFVSRGHAVCANTLTVPQKRVDLTVLHAIERDVLNPQVVEAALTFALEQFKQSDRSSLGACRQSRTPRFFRRSGRAKTS